VVVGYVTGGVGAYLDIAKSSFPTLGWIALFVISSLVVPFIPYHKMRTSRELLRTKLEDIESSRPDIEFVSAISEKTRIPHTRIEDKQPYITSLIFANNPEYPTDAMIARNVRAYIIFNTCSTKPEELCSGYGNWQTQSSNCTEVDMPPNSKPYRLNIALKYHDEQYCCRFGYDALETNWLYDIGTKKQLDIGKYVIEVLMQGTNIRKLFRFLLKNGGRNQGLTVEQITGIIHVDPNIFQRMEQVSE